MLYQPAWSCGCGPLPSQSHLFVWRPARTIRRVQPADRRDKLYRFRTECYTKQQAGESTDKKSVGAVSSLEVAEQETYKLLEWPELCKQVAAFTKTVFAAERVLNGEIPIGKSQVRLACHTCPHFFSCLVMHAALTSITQTSILWGLAYA